MKVDQAIDVYQNRRKLRSYSLCLSLRETGVIICIYIKRPFSTDSVKSNGELVSRLEQHASADSVGDEAPKVHANAQLDVPAEGVHRVLVQDGAHVSVHDATPTAVPIEEQTTKVFSVKNSVHKNQVLTYWDCYTG